MVDKILVAVVSRTDTPFDIEDVCTVCHHFVRLDPQAEVAITAGGRALCLECARILAVQHPEAFSEDTLARLPDTELAPAYPASYE